MPKSQVWVDNKNNHTLGGERVFCFSTLQWLLSILSIRLSSLGGVKRAQMRGDKYCTIAMLMMESIIYHLLWPHILSQASILGIKCSTDVIARVLMRGDKVLQRGPVDEAFGGGGLDCAIMQPFPSDSNKLTRNHTCLSNLPQAKCKVKINGGNNKPLSTCM